MGSGEFRCAFFARDYGASLAFYRDGLGLPVVEAWDRGPDDRGTLFRAAAGIVEVLARPRRRVAGAVWDYRPPQGFMLVIEVDDVDAWYARAVDRRLDIKESLTNQPWGHRTFVVTDPDGITAYVFSPGPSTEP